MFFSFTTDPCLPETWEYTAHAIRICSKNNVPVKVLTKCSSWISDFLLTKQHLLIYYPTKIAIGFALTGHDELEPNAATNHQRIEAMATLYNYGYKTFASIEPIIDLDASLRMIKFAATRTCEKKKKKIKRRKERAIESNKTFKMFIILQMSY